MRFVRRLLGGREGSTQSTEMPADLGLRALLTEHGLAAFERQLAFAEIAGDLDWILDQDDGLLRLGGDLALPAQIIGTTSKKSRTWLWAWENPSISDLIAARAREVARVGRERGIDFLVRPELDLASFVDGHLVALAVSGLIDADAYYRGPHPGGEVFILVTEPRVRQPAGIVEARVVDVVSQALVGVPQLVTSAGVANYLRHCGLRVTEALGEVRSDSAVFRFDQLGRLSEMTGSIGSAEART